ncbi:MAG: hypothetical protein CM1200mP2_38390 [Planctomycetaceae bacterium]|nr:MAG: hypothetical protein CM1200mP2_38390 [Planctomycetaceae bacterium]
MRLSTPLSGLVLLLVTAGVVSVAPAAEPRLKPVVGFLKIPPKGVPVGAASGWMLTARDRFTCFTEGRGRFSVSPPGGKLVRSWGDDLIGNAHGLRVDRDDNVWVTDIGPHMVFKFSPQREKFFSLSDRPTRRAPGATCLTNQPMWLSAPPGEIYVSDGYGNSRVMKFDAKGKYLTSWGKPGGWQKRIRHSPCHPG